MIRNIHYRILKLKEYLRDGIENMVVVLICQVLDSSRVYRLIMVRMFSNEIGFTAMTLERERELNLYANLLNNYNEIYVQLENQVHFLF